jgi:ribosomal protein L37AE/L43A
MKDLRVGASRSNRDAYKDAVDKVRSAHKGTVTPAHATMECPRCHTKQVVHDEPGKRVCMKCGFEFRPFNRMG